MPCVPKIRASLFAITLVSLLPLALTGCGVASGDAAKTANPLIQGGTMSGAIHGGNQPISGGTISLYAAGVGSYGAAGTLYAQTTSGTTGLFAFHQTNTGSPTGPPSTISDTYGCPTGAATNTDPQMYIVASGGETQGVGNGSNSAAAFILALGKCSTVGSLVVNMNEISSVATMAALQQYFNPVNESLGYPNTTQAIQGFANGVATISVLEDVPYGQAYTSTTTSATPLGATNSVTVTITPETSQINTIANILAACVNNTSRSAANCTTLFGAAVPPAASVTSQPSQTFTAITSSNEDTLQALYFMLTNPTAGNSKTNMNSLFGLSSSTAPFQPSYATAPTDWTVAVSYSSSNTCTLNANAGTTSTIKFINAVNDPAIDAQGNVWAAANGTVGGLFEISPTGVPMTCGMGTLANSAAPVVLDAQGNAWVGSGVKVSSYYHFYKWNASGGVLDSTWPTSTTNAPLAVAVDGHNNVFYADSSNLTTYDTTSGTVSQFVGAGASGASVTAGVKVATINSSPAFMAVDSSDNVWTAIVAQGTNTTQATQAFFETYPSNNTGGTTYFAGTSDGSHTGFETANVAGSNIYNAYGVAVGSGGIVYSSNGAGSGSSGVSYRWDIITPTGTGTVSTTNTAVNVAGNFSVRGVAVDGASNVWQSNNNGATGNWVTGATSSGLFSVSEISSTGTPLSATSATGTGAYGVNTGSFQKPAAFLKFGARGIAIDPTGNVWVGQNSATATNIMELVGAAVPVVTPLAVGAANGTLGQKP